MWPRSAGELIEVQRELAAAEPPPWRPVAGARALIGACFACAARGTTGPGASGEPTWAAAVVLDGRRAVAEAVVAGKAGAPYEPGLLALRDGALLAAAVRALDTEPDVLLVDATGRDHPRGAGLALHLGAVLGLPTVGVTARPLLAAGDWPHAARGAASPIELDGRRVGAWVRTRDAARPLAAHAGWRTDTGVAVEVVLAASRGHRTPEAMRRARRLARVARAETARG
jgi:deoxyribonuclease V